MPTPPRDPQELIAVVEAVEQCIAQGFAAPDAPHFPGRPPSALAEAGRRLGITRQKVRDCWQAAHKRETFRTVQTDRTGEVVNTWERQGKAARLADDAVALPDPKVVTKVSTLYDRHGDVTQQWVQERPQDVQQLAVWSTIADELKQDLPRYSSVQFRRDLVSEELLAVFPIGDHHTGMLAWPEETGEAWDLELAERTLDEAITDLVTSVPSCTKAAVVFLGDYAHYDSFVPVTPTHHNPLDADGRFPKLVRAAIRMMRRAIERTAEHHRHVVVIVASGNHDPVFSVFLREMLANVYEADPRIEIDTSPRPFHFLRHGKCFFGVHHGDRVKLEDLPLLMATDRPQDWGETVHRVWLTGHRHVRRVIEKGGCLVESFRVLPPTDAYAAGKGYRAQREMHAIVYHAEHGERIRHTYRP